MRKDVSVIAYHRSRTESKGFYGDYKVSWASQTAVSAVDRFRVTSCLIQNLPFASDSPMKIIIHFWNTLCKSSDQFSIQSMHYSEKEMWKWLFRNLLFVNSLSLSRWESHRHLVRAYFLLCLFSKTLYE